ncbi:DUF982 domain-containing protein [Mesorhizobium sp. KR2-14]|uniref:DUF982 domain-containing protein n=1 Tax=Mesorhizobium sp. KR2-14 TaxID=3156610 RepID=UPI0032B4B326
MDTDQIFGWFDKPVPVSVGLTHDVRNISNARQALDILMNHWPSAGTQQHRDARQACLEVLRGERRPEDARKAFAEAARGAGILFELG